ncbi:MAG: cytochrome B6, partial [Candidatus Scalindua sp.]|nr:cytochrome B6 [Candidatus Scalindua sp.]
MRKMTGKCFMVMLFVFAVMLVVSVVADAKEMKMQESSYAPVMITKSFKTVREMDVAEKAEVMSKHMAMLNERYDLSGKTDPVVKMSG